MTFFSFLPCTGGGMVMILSVPPKVLDVPVQSEEAKQKNSYTTIYNIL